MRYQLFLSSLIVLIPLFICNNQINALDHKALRGLREKVSAQLFGRIWKVDESCNDKRTEPDILADEIESEEFVNGKRFNPKEGLIKNLTLGDLHNLNYLGAKSRILTSVLCTTNSWGYADQELFKVLNEASANETECRTSLDSLYNFINRITRASCSYQANTNETISANCERISDDTVIDIEKWTQFNSFGRIPSGLIFNNHIWPGDYEGCTRNPSMRYCLGEYKGHNWKEKVYPKPNSFRIGLCLPKSCNDYLLESNSYIRKIDILIKRNLIESLGLADDERYSLASIHCPPTKESLYRKTFNGFFPNLLVSILLGWFAILVYASITGEDSLKCFNIRNNWTKFMKKPDSRSNLAGLDCIKVLTLFWIMISHINLILRSYLNNFHEIRNLWNKSEIGSIIIQGQHAVPAFFMISGMLVGLKWLKKGNNSKLNIPKFIILRYMRLAPLYLVVYAYTKTFFHLMGSGPFWDHGVSMQSENRQCMLESWFVPILMLSNFVQPFAHCILTGWHIANDFQIYLILPAIIIIYRRSRIFGRISTILCFILSHLYHVYIFHERKHFSFNQMANEPPTIGPAIIANRMIYDYLNPFGRFGTYLIGVFLADMMISMDQDKSVARDGKSLFWSRVRVIFCSVTGSVALLICVLAPTGPPERKYFFGPYDKSVAYPFARFLVEIGWLFLLYGYLGEKGTVETMEKVGEGQGEREREEKRKFSSLLSNFLKLPIWSIIVKLNYSFILTHFAVARYLIQTETNLLVFSWINFFQFTIFIIFLSYLVSLFVYLTIEIPLTWIVDKFMETIFSSCKNNVKKL